MLYDLTYIVESKKTELKQNWDTEERLVVAELAGEGKGWARRVSRLGEGDQKVHISCYKINML